MSISTTARKHTKLLALAVGATIMLSGVQASPASAALSTPEKKLVSLINKARTKRGLGKLKVNGALSKKARKHSTAMMKQGNPVMHSSTKQLFNYMDGANCVARIGENVGTASSVTEMHQAFMKSPGHRHNILGSWKKVGVGIRISNGRFWTTELFCA